MVSQSLTASMVVCLRQCLCMCVYACVRACLYVCLCVSTHARSLLMQRVVMAAQLGTLPLPLQPVLPIRL